jgi:hypothetical protein
MKDLTRRILWHVNRTPLAHLVKLAVSAAHAPSLAERRRIAKNFGVSAVAQEKAEQLRRDGYVMLTDFLDEGLLAAFDSACGEKLAHIDTIAAHQESANKQFWLRLLDSETVSGAFHADNIFVRFATQPKFIELLCAYMKRTPQLMDVLLTYSRPSDAKLSYSQLWHRDHDDVQTIKIFVYLTDVPGVEQGPFTFLPGPPSDKFGFQLKSHMDDEYFHCRASRNEVIELRAPRLTVFACETSRCYHMGSRVQPGASRLMYTATFIKPPSLFPRKQPRFRTNRPLGEIDRSVLGL